MTGTIHTTQVNGQTFEYWADFIQRGTFAKAEDGTVKLISGGGYIHKDLTVRKAIATSFGLPTFRKNAKKN